MGYWRTKVLPIGAQPVIQNLMAVHARTGVSLNSVTPIPRVHMMNIAGRADIGDFHYLLEKSFTYNLVAGEGDTHNEKFSIRIGINSLPKLLSTMRQVISSQFESKSPTVEV